jgi:predicted amidohydrolase YtcJ
MLPYTPLITILKATAIAIQEGKIIAIGTKEESDKYQSRNTIDAKGKFIYPGLFDAHCHFTILALRYKK